MMRLVFLFVMLAGLSIFSTQTIHAQELSPRALAEIQKSIDDISNEIDLLRGKLQQFAAIIAQWDVIRKNFESYRAGIQHGKAACLNQIDEYQRLLEESPDVARQVEKTVQFCRSDLKRAGGDLQEYTASLRMIQHQVDVVKKTVEASERAVVTNDVLLKKEQAERDLRESMHNMNNLPGQIVGSGKPESSENTENIKGF